MLEKILDLYGFLEWMWLIKYKKTVHFSIRTKNIMAMCVPEYSGYMHVYHVDADAYMD